MQNNREDAFSLEGNLLVFLKQPRIKG